MRGEAEPRSTIMMPNSIMINDFSCDRIYFPRAIVVNRNPPIPLETSALDKLKINTRKKNNRKKRHSSVRLTAGQRGRASRIGRSYNTESGRERGAIKRQTKNKKKKREGKTKFIFRTFRERATRAYGVLSETFIFLLVGRARVHEHNKVEAGREGGEGLRKHW